MHSKNFIAAFISSTSTKNVEKERHEERGQITQA